MSARSNFAVSIISLLSFLDMIRLFLFTVSILKRPITPPATLGMVDYQNLEQEQLMKRLRLAQNVEEVNLIVTISLCNFEHLIMPFLLLPLTYFILSFNN